VEVHCPPKGGREALLQDLVRVGDPEGAQVGPDLRVLFVALFAGAPEGVLLGLGNLGFFGRGSSFRSSFAVWFRDVLAVAIAVRLSVRVTVPPHRGVAVVIFFRADVQQELVGVASAIGDRAATGMSPITSV
jgi:hypothetical protein